VFTDHTVVYSLLRVVDFSNKRKNIGGKHKRIKIPWLFFVHHLYVAVGVERSRPGVFSIY